MTERRFYTLCPECNTTHTKEIDITLFLKGPVEFITDHCKNCGTPFKTKIDLRIEKIENKPLEQKETPLNKEVTPLKEGIARKTEEQKNGTTTPQEKTPKKTEGTTTIGKITTT